MIPKKIHYCWFGRGEKPALAQKCIASWKKMCPDYEIIEWNEDNFDVNYNAYTKYCYENKKWAFLSDLARLIVVEEQGGIYFDTDVEVVRPFDSLLTQKAFWGFENEHFIASGLGFGSVKGHPILKKMIALYNELETDENGDIKLIVCPRLNTDAMVDFGFIMNGTYQEIDGVLALPVDYMNPYDDPTGRLLKTKNTYSIHWYSKSWMSKWTILRSKISKPLHRMFGVDFMDRFRKKKNQ